VVVFKAATALWIDASQKKRLEQLVGSDKTRKKIRLRARIVLLASEGLPNHAIARQLGTSRPTVLLWRGRFKQLGVPGLMRDRPGRKRTLSGEKVRAVVQATLQTTPEGATCWSVRSLAEAQGLSRMAVQRIWKAHKLQAHRVESFELSRDPKFVKKVRDVVGVFVDPLDKALVFSVDEKKSLQTLHRTASLVAVRPGIPARQSQDDEHHGSPSLFAALGLLDGRVIGESLRRHRRLEFIRFFDKIDQETPDELSLHLIVDNDSTHKSPPVKRWLKGHRRFHLHFIPKISSRLSLLEFWFGETTRERIRRGTFESLKELTEAIETYLKAANQNPKIFVWTKAAKLIPGWRKI
jgi:transposase